MSTHKQQLQSPSHFLVTLTGCVLLLTGSAGAHPAVSRENIRPENVLSQSLNGELQSTFRKIRHLVSFFFDKNEAVRPEQTAPVRFAPVSVNSFSGYASVFSNEVRHVKNREIRSWLLRV